MEIICPKCQKVAIELRRYRDEVLYVHKKELDQAIPILRVVEACLVIDTRKVVPNDKQTL